MNRLPGVRRVVPCHNAAMQFQKALIPIGSVVLVVAAYRVAGWAGVVAASAVLVMWLLLHFTRLMQVLQRAANRPIGSVDSAVMFNAKLHSGVSLMHVVAMTRSLGEMLSVKDCQPECYRWTDAAQSSVTCEFHAGKLRKWVLTRPAATPDPSGPGGAVSAP